MEKINNLEQPPTTIEGWYKKASEFDNRFRQTKAIAERMRGGSTNREKKKYNFRGNAPRYVPSVDPNAMNIDRLSMQEKDEHMKKGLCFECHKPGHRASDHRAGTSQNTFRAPAEKMKGKDAYQKIRSIISGLEDEERDVAIKNMEEEGF